jgi:hypothetical protein
MIDQIATIIQEEISPLNGWEMEEYFIREVCLATARRIMSAIAEPNPTPAAQDTDAPLS